MPVWVADPLLYPEGRSNPMLLTRGLPLFIALGLTIFCLIECLSTPESEVRTLPKGGWVVLVLVPFAGPVAWFLAGRPQGLGSSGPGGGVPPQHLRRSGPLGPDDDPDFLRRLDPAADQDRRDEGHDPGPG